MEEEKYNLDIAEIILHILPEENEDQKRIKFFIKMHKSLCNDYLFTSAKYKDSAIALSNIYKVICADLCKEIFNRINK